MHRQLTMTGEPNSVTLTLQELIASERRYLSQYDLLVDENDALYDRNGFEGRSSDREVVNITKICLVMAKTFDRYTSSQEMDLSSVQLNQISIEIMMCPLVQGKKHICPDTSTSYREPYRDSYRDSCSDEENSRRNEVKAKKRQGKNGSILNMEIHANNECDETKTGQSLIKHIGDLMYALFAQNRDKLPLKSAFSDSSKPGDQDSKSLFDKLLETEELPISVCRLLSDMIDTGKTANPFKTIDEVVDDLEQMSFHPSIFLYDPGKIQLEFGSRHYGQTNEITKLLAMSAGLERSIEDSTAPSASTPAEAVFITGDSGVGKSLLVHRVGEFLTSLGCWVVAKTKFVRPETYASRQGLYNLFDDLISKITAMASSGNAADVDYWRRARRAICEDFGVKDLSILALIIPSINDLIPNLRKVKRSPAVNDPAKIETWKLGALALNLIDTILSLERSIAFCLDDVHQCDHVMLTLMLEILEESGKSRGGRIICFSTYRADGLHGFHPLVIHCNILMAKSEINVSGLRLDSLTKQAVTNMLMTEMRLPRRLVVDIANAVHENTSGHARTVIEVLNTLVSKAAIAYCPQRKRYDYDQDKIAAILSSFPEPKSDENDIPVHKDLIFATGMVRRDLLPENSSLRCWQTTTSGKVIWLPDDVQSDQRNSKRPRHSYSG